MSGIKFEIYSLANAPSLASMNQQAQQNEFETLDDEQLQKIEADFLNKIKKSVAPKLVKESIKYLELAVTCDCVDDILDEYRRLRKKSDKSLENIFENNFKIHLEKYFSNEIKDFFFKKATNVFEKEFAVNKMSKVSAVSAICQKVLNNNLHFVDAALAELKSKLLKKVKEQFK
jgi:hypothetical protein